MLVSDLPWQQDLFKGGNYIDAMALVRREAWEAIGGYTHIPGGWEDFDFWCGVDAGWHGCQPLRRPLTRATPARCVRKAPPEKNDGSVDCSKSVTHGLTCPKTRTSRSGRIQGPRCSTQR